MSLALSSVAVAAECSDLYVVTHRNTIERQEMQWREQQQQQQNGNDDCIEMKNLQFIASSRKLSFSASSLRYCNSWNERRRQKKTISIADATICVCTACRVSSSFFVWVRCVFRLHANTPERWTVSMPKWLMVWRTTVYGIALRQLKTIFFVNTQQLTNWRRHHTFVVSLSLRRGKLHAQTTAYGSPFDLHKLSNEMSVWEKRSNHSDAPRFAFASNQINCGFSLLLFFLSLCVDIQWTGVCVCLRVHAIYLSILFPFELMWS